MYLRPCFLNGILCGQKGRSDRPQEIQRSRRIFRSFFQKRYKPQDRVFGFFRCGRHQRIVQFDGQDNEHDLCQSGRAFKTDLAGSNTLADNLGQYRLQFRDQISQVLLDRKSVV